MESIAETGSASNFIHGTLSALLVTALLACLFFMTTVPTASMTLVDHSASLQVDLGSGSAFDPILLAFEDKKEVLQQLSVRGETLGFEWRVGRMRLAWGAGPPPRLLLSQAGRIDALWGATHFRREDLYPSMDVQVLVGMLGPRGASNRLITARRYEAAKGKLSLGLTEMGIVINSINPLFINPHPLFPIWWTDLLLKITDLIDEDACARAISLDAQYDGEGYSAYAECMFQDVPPVSPWPGPPRGACRLGITFGDRLAWNVDYTAISRYAYSHSAAAGDFINNGASLGHPLGPNADALTLRATLSREHAILSAGVSWERHGPGYIGEWPEGDNQARHFALLDGPLTLRQRLSAGFELPVCQGVGLAGQLGLLRRARTDQDDPPIEVGLDFAVTLQLSD